MARAFPPAVAAALLLACFASSASANGPCSVQEKTPTGFAMKCSEELHSSVTGHALTVWSGSGVSFTASVSSPAGVTCGKRTSGSTTFWDCDGTIPANTTITGNLSFAAGGSPCDYALYGRITYDEFGEDTSPLIGTFDDCSDAPPPKSSTQADVRCVPAAVVAGQTTRCTVTVLDKDASDPSRPTTSVAWRSPNSHGTFPGGAKCVLGPVPNTTDRARCSVDYRPGAVESGNHVVRADYAGDGGHLASLDTTSVRVEKRPTRTRLSCSPDHLDVGDESECVVTVADTGAGTRSRPTGSVKLGGETCKLKKTDKPAKARCKLTYEALTKGPHELTATYGGDTVHRPSKGRDTVTAGK